MKRAVITILALIFSIFFCMAQNIRDAAEEQKRREAQKRQIVEEQKRREAQQPQAVEPQRRQEPQQPQQPQQSQKQQETQQPQAADEQRQTVDEFTTMVTTAGTILRGSNLAYKLDWLQRRAESHNTYIIEVNANENIAPRTLQYSGAINITVILRGDGANRTVRLSSHGRMFTVQSNVTLILDNNITLQGHSGNTNSMIYVDGGTLKMNNGATITGNIRTDSNSGGGGVYVNKGTFEMSGGIISGNKANSGGGVYVSGGFGGSGTFTMTGGTISGNTSGEGGGVNVSGTFTMRGGTITGNAASKNGGGVYVTGTFAKNGGTITGYNSDQKNGNAVRDDDGIIARRGHAVYINHWNSNQRKETTAGSNVNLSNDSADNWDQ